MYSTYLAGGFDITLRRFTVSVLVRYLQPRLYNGDFTHIYVRGLSGLTVGSMVAYELDAPLVALRKGDSHGDSKIEGLTESAKCCIIDDLLSSGDTLSVMRKALYAPEQLVGVCFYNSHGGWEWKENLKWIKPLTWLEFHCKTAYNYASCYSIASPTKLARIYTQLRETEHAVS